MGVVFNNEASCEAEKQEMLRYNQNKLRVSLVPVSAIEGIASVLTYGANKEFTKVMTYGYNKYTVKDEEGNVLIDGANNWRSGSNRTSVIDSLERHLLAFKRGEDRCSESGELHIDHLMCNAAFLKEFYRIHPDKDDRIKY